MCSRQWLQLAKPRGFWTHPSPLSPFPTRRQADAIDCATQVGVVPSTEWPLAR